jgi:hypothetical protein
MLPPPARGSIPESIHKSENLIEKTSKEAVKTFPMTFTSRKARRYLSKWKENDPNDPKACDDKYDSHTKKSEDRKYKESRSVPYWVEAKSVSVRFGRRRFRETVRRTRCRLKHKGLLIEIDNRRISVDGRL